MSSEAEEPCPKPGLLRTEFLEPDLIPNNDRLTVPMILHCPMCHARHIDEGQFANKAHHTHACQECGNVWRPAKMNTHGVRFLPGYKNAPEPQS